MNSSPPAPSYTLPPLTSKGVLPVTPSPTPSPGDDKVEFDFGDQNLGTPSKNEKGKSREKGIKAASQGTHDIAEDGGRVSTASMGFGMVLIWLFVIA